MPDSVGALAHALVERAGAAGVTVATAESLTAGQIAATIADVPGASAVLRGGLIVYATDLKRDLAGVDAGLLDDRGPVDPDVARALAEGAARRCRADIGIGATGVAGPDPQDGHAVGEVYVAVWCSTSGGDVASLDGGERYLADVSGGAQVRAAVRSAATTRALELAVAAVAQVGAGGGLR